MAHPITDWKHRFLERRGLQSSTGMPLYSYRTTTAEFEDLEATLKDRLKSYLAIATLGDVARQIPFFPALFVLYAAEWWRRCYDGSGFSWEPIVEGLGARPDGWTQAQRSDCVERGLQDWRLRLINTHGLRFLGSIAFQGGLPMQLLASARGNIGRVLGRVLRLAATSGGVEAVDVQEWIKSLSTYLPNAYRQNEIFVLLAEVILSVLRLKQAANLQTAHGAVEALERFDPQWRNSFPLPIEDAQAQGLIEQLIKDAADARLVRPAKTIAVERRLEQSDGETWQVRADVDLPEYITATELGSLFGADSSSMTRVLTLRFSRGGRIVELNLRKLAGQERYRIDRLPLDCLDTVAIAEHAMTLISPEGEVRHGAVARGAALNSDLPWVFEESISATQALRLVRQGSGSVTGLEAWICVPDNWMTRADDGGLLPSVGRIVSLRRNLVKIKGSVRLEDPDGTQFRIRCGQAATTEEHLELRGARIWESFIRPEVAFRGIPRLYRVSEEGLAQPVDGSINWRLPGGRSTLTPGGLLGPAEAVWPAGGDIRWRSRLVLTPEQAELRIEPGASPSQGQLRFVNWGLLSAQMRTADVALRAVHDGNELVVHVEYSGERPPEWCELELLWRGNPNTALVRLPFPARGVRAFDANGSQVSDEAAIAVGQMVGVRLVGFLGREYRAELTLRLHGGAGAAPATLITRQITPNQGESRVEVRLIDYAHDIQRMLGSADALDASVSVRLQFGNGQGNTLRITRYACPLERLADNSAVTLRQPDVAQLTIDDLESIPARALRLDAPGEEPLVLEPLRSENVPTGAWYFPADEVAPGPWLIYPGATSKIVFRPLLWAIQASSSSQGRLNEALGVSSEAPRHDALDAVITELADNYCLPDWQQVEQLATQLGHLPLSTLDLWRRVARSSDGIVAMSIRVGALQVSFVQRFSTELPFMWETVPLSCWVKGVQRLRDQCAEWYGAESANTVFTAHLDRRIQDIASANPALRVLLEVARTIVTGVVTPDVALARRSVMDSHWRGLLFDGGESCLQILLRSNADAQWPGGLAAEVERTRRGAFADYLCPTSYGFHDAVINIPIVLAVCAVTEEAIAWAQEESAIQILRTMQSFDPEWFAEAYDLTVARCLAKNAIQLP